VRSQASTGGPTPVPVAIRRVAVAVAAVPAVLLAHVLASGTVPGTRSTAAVATVVVLVALLAPVRRRAGLALAMGVAQLSGHAVLLLSRPADGAVGCLPALGRGARAGLRMAGWDPAPACPQGMVAVDPRTAAAAAALVTAMAIVLGHALAVLLASVAVLLAEGARAVVTALLRGNTLVTRWHRPIVGRLPVRQVGRPLAAMSGRVPSAVGVRGPPPALPA
jgi:hypothetical protein